MILNVNKQEVQALYDSIEHCSGSIYNNLAEKLKRLQSTTTKQATDEQVKEYLSNLPK